MLMSPPTSLRRPAAGRGTSPRTRRGPSTCSSCRWPLPTRELERPEEQDPERLRVGDEPEAVLDHRRDHERWQRLVEGVAVTASSSASSWMASASDGETTTMSGEYPAARTTSCEYKMAS